MEYIAQWSKHNKSREGKLTEADISVFIKESEQEFLNIPNFKQEMDRVSKQLYSSPEFNRQLWYREQYLAHAIGNLEMIYPVGKVIQQPRSQNLFRGEIRPYPESVASLHRALAIYKTEKDRALYRLVSDMRIYEFSCLLCEFEHVRDWKICDVVFDALAQHYGLQTCWLDITSHFLTAMFFANCWYDYQEDRWKPLLKSDRNWSEYGILYHAPSYAITNRWMSSGNGYVVDKYENGFRFHSGSIGKVISDFNSYGYPVMPIGYQPFQRCHLQHAYGLYSYGKYSLNTDQDFERLVFSHSDELSIKIFEMAEGGRLIYPQEGLDYIRNTLKKIATSTEFTIEALRYALYRSHYYALSEENECLMDLESFSIEGRVVRIVDSSPWFISSSEKARINEYYSHHSPEINTAGFRIYGEDCYCLQPWMIPEKAELPHGAVDFKPMRVNDSYSFITYSAYLWLNMLETSRMPAF